MLKKTDTANPDTSEQTEPAGTNSTDSALKGRVAVAAAALLIFSGGCMDAFTFVGHGGVFANAQTGNVVLAGVAAVSGHWKSVGTELLSVSAFLAGTIFARVIQRLALRIGWSPSVACLLAEVAVLMPLAIAAHLMSDAWVVVMIAFAAAIQFTGFTEADVWAYTSTVTTGNLRRLADAAVAVVVTRGDRDSRRQAIVYVIICFAFLFGAVVGTLTTRRWGNPAILVPVSCQLTVLGIFVISRTYSNWASSPSKL